MKRASLKLTPATASKEPTDLTDRLLDREAERPLAPAPPKARAARPAQRPAPAPAIEPEASPPVSTPVTPGTPPAPELVDGGMAAALDQAQVASRALEVAAQAAPARYSVALRYRLEALALHLRQVADFVNRLNPKA